MLISFCRLSFCPQSVRVPSVTLPTRTPRATTTSPWTATSRDTTTCRRSADPPPPGEHISDGHSSRASFPPPHFWDDFRPVLARKRANSQLFSDNQSCRPPTEQRRGICPTEEPLFFLQWMLPLPPFTSTLPLCGLKWYSPHRDRLVIQSREPAGCGEEGWTVATPAGLQLHSSPVGKIRHKTFCG